MSEIQQERGLQSSDIEVTEHLGQMAVIEVAHDFGIDDDLLVNNQVWHECAYQLAPVAHGELSLRFALHSEIGKFEQPGTLIFI